MKKVIGFLKDHKLFVIFLLVYLIFVILYHIYVDAYISSDLKHYVKSSNDIVSHDKLIENGFICYDNESEDNELYNYYNNLNSYDTFVNISISVVDNEASCDDFEIGTIAKIFKSKYNNSNNIKYITHRYIRIQNNNYDIMVSINDSIFNFRMNSELQSLIKNILTN